MHFANRSEAGKQLAKALGHYRGQDVVVLALPRGGVPVATEVASHLVAPLDLLLVRKIGVPWRPELAMGAVIDGSNPTVVRNEETIRFSGVSEAEFDDICQSQLVEIERRRQLYFAGCPPAEIAGRIAIIVDDGIATGAMRNFGRSASNGGTNLGSEVLRTRPELMRVNARRRKGV